MVTNNPVTDTSITKDFFPQILSRTSMGLLNFERQVTALLATHCYEVISFELCFFQRRLLLVNSSSMGTARMAPCPEILSDACTGSLVFTGQSVKVVPSVRTPEL